MPARPLLILLTAAIASTAQAAAEPERIASVTVPLNDLDLTTEAGVTAALARLDQAAYRACGGNPIFHRSYEIMPRETVKVYRECRDDAVARAVAEIAMPALSQARAGRVLDDPRPER